MNMKVSIAVSITIFASLYAANVLGFGFSDLDPFNKKGALREGLREIDPTSKNSTVREGLRQVDPTSKNSAVRKAFRELDPTSKNSAIRKATEALLNLPCATPFYTYINGVNLTCVIDNGSSGSGNIKDAIDILTKNGFYAKSEFDNVHFQWCTPLKVGASGMVTGAFKDDNNNDISVISLSREYRHASADTLTPLIGHEMVHVRQIRRKSFPEFACQYSGEILSGKGYTCPPPRNSSKGNFLECEAYKFEDSIEENLSKTYTYLIMNKTNDKISFTIDGKQFSIDANHKTRFNSKSKRGEKPVITFDYSYASGFQKKSYNIGDFNEEIFKTSGNGIDLYH